MHTLAFRWCFTGPIDNYFSLLSFFLLLRVNNINVLPSCFLFLSYASWKMLLNPTSECFISDIALSNSKLFWLYFLYSIYWYLYFVHTLSWLLHVFSYSRIFKTYVLRSLSSRSSLKFFSWTVSVNLLLSFKGPKLSWLSGDVVRGRTLWFPLSSSPVWGGGGAAGQRWGTQRTQEREAMLFLGD